MSLAPPDGWSVTSGVWGTNLDIDTSQYVTGLASLRLSYDATTAVPEIWSPWIPIADTNGMPFGTTLYTPRIRVRASSVAAGDTVTIQFIRYQPDRATVADTRTLYNAVLNTANTWEEYGAVSGVLTLNAPWGRFRLTKANNNFNVWFDEIHNSETVPFWSGTGSLTTLTPAIWTPIELTTYQRHLVSLTAPSELRIYRPGVYSVGASLRVINAVLNEQISGRIVNTTTNITIAYTVTNADATNGNATLPMTGARDINLTSTTGPYNAIQIQALAPSGAQVASGFRAYILCS